MGLQCGRDLLDDLNIWYELSQFGHGTIVVYIKLGLDYGILNLSIVEFILIYPILGLVDCVCNLDILG